MVVPHNELDDSSALSNCCIETKVKRIGQKDFEISSFHDGFLLIFLAASEPGVALAVGLSVGGTSFLTLSSFLLWFLKYFRKKGEGCCLSFYLSIYQSIHLSIHLSNEWQCLLQV